MKRLKKLQTLIKIHYNTELTTVLAMINIPLLKHRVDTMKINAYLKMKQNKDEYPSRDVQTQLKHTS